jgi:hypothetical protein
MIQEQVEQLFSKRTRRSIILGELSQEEWFNDAINKSVEIVMDYYSKEYEPEKRLRIDKGLSEIIEEDELPEFIESIFLCTVETYMGIPIVSVAAMLAGKLPNLSKKDAIHTMAEILAILGKVDLYDVHYGRYKQVCISNRINLDKETKSTLNKLMYLPPMISEPRIVSNNRDSYQYSLDDESLILGVRENFHTGNIGLDVLNKLSQQPLAIDTTFLKTNKPIKPEGARKEDWDAYIEQLEYVYEIIGDNTMYITYKPDMRGREYSQGYHVNSQGNDYHKAVIELANKEHVTIDDPEL